MANIGCKYLRYGLINDDDTTYEAPKTMAKAISCTVSLNISEGSLYADDMLAEYETNFQSANITLTIDNDDDTVFAQILGKTIDSSTKLVTSNIDDTPPYVGFGYIVSKVKNNVRIYRAQFFPKIKFKPFIADANTKGDSISYGTPSVEGVTIANNIGVWEKHQEFSTENEAITGLDEFFTQSTTPPVVQTSKQAKAS